MSAIAFCVPGRPVTWQRGVRGIRFDARGKAAKDYREKVALFAVQALAHAKRAGVVWPSVREIEHAFRVDVAGWWPDRNEGDEDRMVSLVRDALEGVVYKTDRQVKASRNGIGQPSERTGIVVVVRHIDAEAREAWALGVMDEARELIRSHDLTRHPRHM